MVDTKARRGIGRVVDGGVGIGVGKLDLVLGLERRIPKVIVAPASAAGAFGSYLPVSLVDVRALLQNSVHGAFVVRGAEVAAVGMLVIMEHLPNTM